MCRKSYLVISGVFFGLVAIGHLARLVYHLPVRIGEWTVPTWPTWVALVVAGILSIWAFSLLCNKCEQGEKGSERQTK